MSILDNIKNDIITAGKWTEKEFESLGHLLVSGIEQFNTEYGPAVLAAAQAIVPVLAEVATGVSGPGKAKIAAAAIGSTLEQQGIQVGVQVGASMINSAIEQVVASLSKTPAPATAPAEQGNAVQIGP